VRITTNTNDISALQTDTTPAAILAKIITVDGAGSGLDADTLDGQTGSYYLDLANATGKVKATSFDDTSHGQRAGGNLHPLATPTVEGFMRDAASDDKQYVRKNGAWMEVSVPPGTYVGENPPPNPPDNQMWMRSSTGALYIYYFDGNSRQWMQVSASPQVSDTRLMWRTALPKNIITNPNMRISQQNAQGVGSTSGFFMADQWVFSFVGLTAYGTSFINGSPVTPDGSASGINFNANAKASLAAGDYLYGYTHIEGNDVRDILWGTPQAKPMVVRFNAKATAAGNYSLQIRNAAGDRSYVALFNVAVANTWQTFVMAIPGDTTGTWEIGSVRAMSFGFCHCAGATYIAPVAGWNAGNYLAAPGQVNGAAASGQNLYISDVGFYVDPDNTGLPPEWELPDFNADLLRCLRYYQVLPNVYGGGWCGAANMTICHPVCFTQMRATPTAALSGIANNNTTSNAFTLSGNNMGYWKANGVAVGGYIVQGDVALSARM
jgi:hypothetical protein